MFCKNCGDKQIGNYPYCINCGASLAGGPAFQEEVLSSSPISDVSLDYAAFWRRLVAALIDTVIFVIIGWLWFAVILYVMIPVFADSDLAKDNPGALIFISYVVPGWLYNVLLERSSRQATLGKMVLGIIVTDDKGNRISIGRATGRYFAKYISTIILYTGFLLVLFTRKKQGLHDMLAGTLVLRK